MKGTTLAEKRAIRGDHRGYRHANLTDITFGWKNTYQPTDCFSGKRPLLSPIKPDRPSLFVRLSEGYAPRIKPIFTMKTIYLAQGDQQSGPFEEANVRKELAEGLLEPDTLCWKEGMATWEPVGKVLGMSLSPTTASSLPTGMGEEAAADPAGQVNTGVLGETELQTPLFLYIPVNRLIVLSILSMSIYDAYWIYKNWRYLKERQGLRIRPFWRGWFGIFYCHSLLNNIHDDEEARQFQEPTFSPGALATGWVLLLIVSNIISRLPSIEATLIAAVVPGFLCLMPVQKYINAVTEQRNPQQTYYGWSAGHIVCLVLGGLIWAILLLGLVAEQSGI